MKIRDLSPRAEFFLIVAICFGYFICNSAIVLLLRIHRFEMTTGRVLRGTAVELLSLALAGWILHQRGWTLRPMGRFSFAAALAGVPLAIGYFILYFLAAFSVMSLFPGTRNLTSIAMVQRAAPAAMLVFVVVNSFFEELAVTGYVVSALSQEGMAFAVTASTLLRFLYHLYQGPVASLSILPLGMLFACVYWRWRNLWPLVVAHTIANLVVMFATR